jgi:hypothetical protein
MAEIFVLMNEFMCVLCEVCGFVVFCFDEVDIVPVIRDRG